MKRTLPGLVLTAAVIFSGTSAYAHHSFSATYLEGQMVTVEGTVTQFMFRNPHSYLHVDAPDSKGAIQSWAIEWAGPNQLGNNGITRDTLKPGDHVIVVGEPSRNAEDHRLRMIKVTRPADGWKWNGAYD